MKTLSLAFIATLLLAPTSLAEKRDVSFNAADGFQLKASFYSAERGGPGILLLHQCNADRQIYDHLAMMLNNAGYNVLTFDFRGFGGSKAGQYTDFTAQRQKIIERMPGDVDSALNFMTSQSTVNKRALGVLGGNCAVNQAVQVGRRVPEIRTLVLLSGGTDAEGEAYIKNSSKIPILGVVSDEDTNAVAATKKVIEASTHRDSHLEMLKGAGHAASMFAKAPDLEPDIVIWFRSNLPVGGYGLPPAIK